MEWTSNEVIGVISYLLPGFVAAWVFFGLTAHPRPSPFERIVQALIFTAIVQALTAIVRAVLMAGGQVIALGVWSESAALIWSVLIAFAIGLLFAGFTNNDTVHSWLRARRWHLLKRHQPSAPETLWGWTRETSYPSVWYGAFNQSKHYIVLHLSGGRRLYGWPEEWPDGPDTGHFLIAEAEWLLEDNERVPLENVWNMLVPAADVELVEFMYNREALTRS